MMAVLAKLIQMSWGEPCSSRVFWLADPDKYRQPIALNQKVGSPPRLSRQSHRCRAYPSPKLPKQHFQWVMPSKEKSWRDTEWQVLLLSTRLLRKAFKISINIWGNQLRRNHFKRNLRANHPRKSITAWLNHYWQSQLEIRRKSYNRKNKHKEWLWSCPLRSQLRLS